MSDIVVDSSVVAKWILPEPQHWVLICRAGKHLAQSRQDRNLAARIVETVTKTENGV